MKKHPEENVHVRIDAPVQKRQEILQSAIDLIQLQKRHENLVRIRQEKDGQYAQFRKVLGSIKRLVWEIQVKELPLEAEDMRHIKGVKLRPMFVPSPRSQKVAKKEEPRKTTLDAQLDALQRKLRSL